VTVLTASSLIIIDSSGWLEYITKDTKSDLFVPYFKRQLSLLVPTLVLFEVRKVLLLRGFVATADLFVSEAERYTGVDLNRDIALEAAKLSLRHQLHMADALIYATAQQHRAELITSDSHFASLPGVTMV
jgi:toxin FitB